MANIRGDVKFGSVNFSAIQHQHRLSLFFFAMQYLSTNKIIGIVIMIKPAIYFHLRLVAAIL